jgi:glycerol-3-phosphate acyltransferase PlsX
LDFSSPMERRATLGRATPIPDLKKEHPTVMLDAGANAEATVPMLLQFAQMGAAYSTKRYGVARPRVALLSIGEEKSKGTPLVKETHALLAEGDHGNFDFVGNVEGRDFFEDQADVIVTDGFTGNVALKTLEGTLRFLMDTLTEILGRSEVADAAATLFPHLIPLATRLDPESTGGAMLLGVDGVCVISHGSSTSVATVNAITVAHDVAVGGLVAAVASSVRPPIGNPS